MSIPCMLEKDCNGNSISNFPPCYAFQMNWPLGRFSLLVVMSVIGKKNFETVVAIQGMTSACRPRDDRHIIDTCGISADF